MLTINEIDDIVKSIKFLNFRFEYRYHPDWHELELRMSAMLPDNDDRSKTTQVKSNHKLHLTNYYTAENLVNEIRYMLHNWATHEVDELIIFKGEKPFNPHDYNPGIISKIINNENEKEETAA